MEWRARAGAARPERARAGAWSEGLARPTPLHHRRARSRVRRPQLNAHEHVSHFALLTAERPPNARERAQPPKLLSRPQPLGRSRRRSARRTHDAPRRPTRTHLGAAAARPRLPPRGSPPFLVCRRERAGRVAPGGPRRAGRRCLARDGGAGGSVRRWAASGAPARVAGSSPRARRLTAAAAAHRPPLLSPRAQGCRRSCPPRCGRSARTRCS